MSCQWIEREGQLSMTEESLLAAGLPRGAKVRSLVSLTVALLLAVVLAPSVALGAGSKSVVAMLGGTSAGTTGGLFNTPRGVAVNQTGAGGVTAGSFYVVDGLNNRVEQFSPAGAFMRAWGWGVIAGTSEFAVCSEAASCTKGLAGTGAGELSSPQGITVDQSNGNVYVSDQGNRRIDVFTATGSFEGALGWGVLNGIAELQFCTTLLGCTTATAAGSGAGQLAAAVGNLAVAPAGSPNVGDLYVADETNRRVDVYKPVLTGSVVTGVSWVAGFGWGASTGAAEFQVCTTTCHAAAAAGTGAGQFATSAPSNVAVDSEGDIYALDAGNKRVQKFSSTPTVLNDAFAASQITTAFGSGALESLALDPADNHVFLAGVESAGSKDVRLIEVEHEGNLIESHGGGLTVTTSNGLAVAEESLGGNIYLSSSASGSRVFALNDTTPSISPVTTFTATEATLEGTLVSNNLDTRYHFEYSSNGSEWTKLPATETDAGTAATTIPVTQAATSLAPNTFYHARLVATRPTGGFTLTSPEVTFTTSGAKPTLEAAVDSIQDTTARLVGSVNPEGEPTIYHFQYASEAEYQTNGYTNATSVPVPSESIGEGHEGLFVAQAITGLTANTTYHFRLIANNASGETPGPDATFTTRLQSLPADNRAYELVTPAEKAGGQGVGSYGARELEAGLSRAKPGLASVNGERYLSNGLAINLTPGEFLYESDYAMSERVSNSVGWVSRSPFTHPEYGSRGGTNVTLAASTASEDLSVFGWGASTGGGKLFPQMAGWSDGVNPHYATDWQGQWELLAPTEEGLGGTYAQFESADGTHLPFQTEKYGQLGPEDPSVKQVAGMALYDDELSGGLSNQFTPNGKRSLVGVCTGEGSERTLIPDVNGSGQEGAQECPAAPAGSSATLISERGASIGRYKTIASLPTTNAVSDSGSRIFFESPDPQATGTSTFCSGTGTSTSCPAQLYIHQLGEAGAPTVRWISRSEVPGQAASLMAPALFEGASVTGSRVFFQTDSPLTADDPNGSGSAPVTTGTPSTSSWDLYEYEVPSNAEGQPNAEDPGDGKLTRISAGPDGNGDCNVSNTGGEDASLRFASKDGVRLYFVCSAPLAGVATNSAPTDGTITTAGGTVTSTATRDLYYYDAEKPLAQRWEFIAELPASGLPGSASGYDVCATAGAEPAQMRGITGAGTQYSVERDRNCFQGTADGTFVTFMTPGRLLASDPQAESVDVYAFDAESNKLIRIDAPQGGAGGTYPCGGNVASPEAFCNGDTGLNSLVAPMLGVATEPTVRGDHIAFFESKSRLLSGAVNGQYNVYEWRNGKLSLISPGTGGSGAFYAGNSANGENVFFETTDKLTWQDVDGVMDVYDARVGGGIPEPAVGAPCEVLAERCQAAAPAPPGTATPASAGQAGDGNLTPTTKTPANKQRSKPKSLTRAQKLANALKQCKHKRSKRLRRSCEAKARKRYGPRIGSRIKAKGKQATGRQSR